MLRRNSSREPFENEDGNPPVPDFVSKHRLLRNTERASQLRLRHTSRLAQLRDALAERSEVSTTFF